MRFDERWNHGPRLVFRRVYELIVGPTPDIHWHYQDDLWHLIPIIDPFIKWQRPVTDSAFHFDKAGVDILFGPWVLCLHWVDH